MSIEKTIAALPAKSEEERQKIRANAQRLLVSGTDQQKADAQAVIDALEELSAAEHKALYDQLSGMTIAQRVVEAFKKAPPQDAEQRVIKVLLDNPGSTSTELSEALGWGGQTWHLHFGFMCAEREVFLWPAPRSEVRPDKKTMTMILADYDEARSTWKMKPEVAEAFKAMGLA